MHAPGPDFDRSADSLSRANSDSEIDSVEIDSVPTSAADVESAGRSCLAIVALAAIIILLLLLWIVVRSTSGS